MCVCAKLHAELGRASWSLVQVIVRDLSLGQAPRHSQAAIIAQAHIFSPSVFIASSSTHWTAILSDATMNQALKRLGLYEARQFPLFCRFHLRLFASAMYIPKEKFYNKSLHTGWLSGGIRGLYLISGLLTWTLHVLPVLGGYTLSIVMGRSLTIYTFWMSL